MRHVAGPQPEARQEQDDRAITPARNDFAIAGRDQPVHLLRRQISRQVGKPPMGIAGNDIGETCLAAAFDSEVPQERAQAGRQLLDGSTAAWLARSRKKLRMAAGSHLSGSSPSAVIKWAASRA